MRLLGGLSVTHCHGSNLYLVILCMAVDIFLLGIRAASPTAVQPIIAGVK